MAVINLAVSDMDRAAPNGTGNFKAGANYAGGLLATLTAQQQGANEALYLDAVEHRGGVAAMSSAITAAASGAAAW